jgi:perosamine synthetase
MVDKYIRSSRPFFPKEDIENILTDISLALEDGQLRNGKNLKQFEEMFSKYIGLKNAIAFDSDSNALETVLHYYGIKGKDVIVSTNSFISVPNSVIYEGGKVVFTDINASTLSMDSQSLEENITKNTCGIIVTHIAGFPNPNLENIVKICKEHNLFLIEDATHAAGAIRHNRKIGTFGDAAIFAFTPTKVLTTGEGGMLVTNNERLSEFAKRYRYYGSGQGKTEFVELGRHMLLPEISAILGIHQLKRIEEFVRRRNNIAQIYNEELDSSYKWVSCAADDRCSYYKYPLILDNATDRPSLVDKLSKVYGIETGNIFYPPCHMQAFYKVNHTNTPLSLHVSEKILEKTIALPIHAAMSDEDAEYIVKSLNSIKNG